MQPPITLPFTLSLSRTGVDRIRSISATQMRSGENFGISDSDFIAIFHLDGSYVIQVLIYRAGFYLGNKSYFPYTMGKEDESEIFISFLAQFYQSKKPPKTILTNIQLNSDITNPIFDALYNLHKVKTDINSLKDKHKELLSIAETNAKDSLRKKNEKEIKYSNILTEIQNLLMLEEKPKRIEVFDNSHIMGSYAVGGMVVFTEEGFIKKEYRAYTIQLHQNGDDYAMLSEVMNRRLKKISEGRGAIPDLIIIDGGRGHLNIVANLMKKYQITIPFISISKGRDRDAGNETIHSNHTESFKLDNNLASSKQLQIMRDEAHSFAISSYRKKHQNSFKTSTLEDLPGIGKIRRKKLINYFGSHEAVKNAKIDDLIRVEGINKNLAKKIFNILQGE